MAAIYTQIDSHTLLCFHQEYCILFYTDSLLTVPFSELLSNLYPVFLIKLVMTTKKKHQ